MTIVLVVDDDDGVRLAVQRFLEREGHVVRTAASAAMAIASARAQPPDVVVLDVGLPDGDGYEVMESLRRWTRVPILLLTGRDAPMDRVNGLDLGADDYLVKPALLPEVGARVRALLRRSEPPTGPLRDERLDLVVNAESREVTLRGEPIGLTRREFDLLAYLLLRPNIVVSRDEVLENVWGSSPEYQSGAVITEYMTRLRRKLGPLPFSTVRGIGYRYDPTRGG